QQLIPKASERNPDVNAWASDPMLAADGVTLAFCSDRKRSFWYDVCVTGADQEPKCLVGDESRYNRYPDFFPEGDRILFMAGTEFSAGNRPVYSLWEVSLDGQTQEIAPSDLFTHPMRWVAEQKVPSNAQPKSP
ncbi:MAG: hypothetical protein ACTHK7_08100, partial [Aureliella sp.]